MLGYSIAEWFTELEYEEEYTCYGSGEPYPFSGLDEEDFNKIRDTVVSMLKDSYNKKSEELVKFCKEDQYNL